MQRVGPGQGIEAVREAWSASAAINKIFTWSCSTFVGLCPGGVAALYGSPPPRSHPSSSIPHPGLGVPGRAQARTGVSVTLPPWAFWWARGRRRRAFVPALWLLPWPELLSGWLLLLRGGGSTPANPGRPEHPAPAPSGLNRTPMPRRPQGRLARSRGPRWGRQGRARTRGLSHPPLFLLSREEALLLLVFLQPPASPQQRIPTPSLASWVLDLASWVLDLVNMAQDLARWVLVNLDQANSDLANLANLDLDLAKLVLANKALYLAKWVLDIWALDLASWALDLASWVLVLASWALVLASWALVSSNLDLVLAS